ncbi:TetR/AcrR family transcriptional regulator [Mycobacterium sp. C3-094]|uniref:TetR/AcrR family transcriptional regulator n=1 Tax=Mycobacterium sp. PSTR-4-N TaxID=2917745 RepID=UPI001F151A2D|nr:TetR/AcrR family transcriptional regulator C-terminal domain-containing protein [Mycobacterium sp. PSTR-4-N]MCG7596575.1 TetR/AcrR family transcriptional regulator C-terminal domain-containing protein [Mycobacterium sp. PSTR-4-N]
MSPRTSRRPEALTTDRIVAAAVEILDHDGESALTFRALAARLKTGAGAIYWHVADKDALLGAATESVIAAALPDSGLVDPPDVGIRAVALGIFDAVDAHPWVGAHLVRQPWQPAMVEIYERVGRHLTALGVADEALFHAGSTLVSFVLGVAGQNAANARQRPPGADRAALLDDMAQRWQRYDAQRYPVVHRMAAQLRDHDDREQFLAGIDILLAGLAPPGG